VVAIGAITNVASAILLEPAVAENTVVVWLGGHAFHYHDTAEFNMKQDIAAARVVYNSGAPFSQQPCNGVVSEFRISGPELDYWLAGKNALCDYLVGSVAAECDHWENEGNAPSRIIWDVTAAAVLICPEHCNMVTIPRPIVTSDGLYAYDSARPHFVYVRALNRDRIYGDLFEKLKSAR
jgi:inosine-uridine nucleoside N-ribohydrolase